ncbi:MAG: hypothetical protein HY319_01515 [Armatimonadetes bacterium]|nr:hypothetical protein [Armatimonadota bacterium]
MCSPHPALAAALAREHLRTAGDLRLRTALGLDPGRPVVATGHQPEFFHAGVWFRLFLIDEMARREGLQAIFVVVDSDRCRRSARIPCLSEGCTRARDIELEPPLDVPSECAPAPSPAAWERFVDGIEGCLGQSTGRLRSAGREALRGASDDAAFHMRLRQALEPESPRREVRLSELCRSSEFREFSARLAGNRFREAYNRAVRGSGHRPVRSLEAGELPLWRLEGVRRVPARKLAGELRPRALALTMFLRLYLCDLFLHGTGGLAYEAVNDALLRDFLSVPSAPVAVASATLAPGLGRRPPEVVRSDLRRVSSAPEAFLDDPELARLRAELRSAPRARRALLHRRLAQLDPAARLEPVRLRLESELADSRAAWRRDYAYFIHRAPQLQELAEGTW